jgi:C_GCAxxG_C_C family probable redox protein
LLDYQKKSIFVSAKVIKIMETLTIIDVEERVERARNNFKAGYNCAQAVAMTFSDVINLPTEDVVRLAASFGGGMGRMREVCGAVSGMSLVASAVSPAVDPKNMEARMANYALVQLFAERFRAENGDIVCRRLLGLDSATERAEGPMPSQRTESYYRKRPCVEYVAAAARIVAEYIAKGE